jgi:hypothetical protein
MLLLVALILIVCIAPFAIAFSNWVQSLIAIHMSEKDDKGENE